MGLRFIMTQSESLLAPYIDHYQDLQQEGVFLGRMIGKCLKHISTSKAEAFEALYLYARILDDAVDTDKDLPQIIQILQTEFHALLHSQDTPLYQQFIAPFMRNFDCNQQILIRKHLARILKGLMIDATLRITQSPLSEQKLEIRNFLDLWPEVAVACIIVAGKNPTPTKNTVKLMDSWGKYDNLRDLSEDLSHGLILISQEDATAEKITFTQGENIPTQALQQYYTKKRTRIASDLVKHAKDIFQWNIPHWISVPGYFYFISRPLKLIPKLDTTPVVFNS